jgi:hypothetical protein
VEQIEVASERFNLVAIKVEFTRVESELSFSGATMKLPETLRQVTAEICEDHKQISQMRLESIAGAENPENVVYVTRCQPVEVTPRTCTNETTTGMTTTGLCSWIQSAL